MSKIPLFLFYLCLVSLLAGAAVKAPFGPSVINIYAVDLIVLIMVIFWIIHWRQLIRIIRHDRGGGLFFLFVLVGLLSLLWSPVPLSAFEKIISSFYLLRFTAYFSVYCTILFCLKRNFISPRNLVLSLGLTGLAFVFIGWLQYFLYPDLRNLSYLGWDPHYKRIFATILDPNYLGLILTLALIAFFASPGTVWVWTARAALFITLAFTYSRSSFLAYIAAAGYYGAVKKRYLVFAAVIALFALTVFLLPRPGGAGVRLERTFSISQRWDTWRQGLTLFAKHPTLGVGFNSIRYAKKYYRLSQQPKEDHAGAGFDNSFITIVAATGTIGLAVYILMLMTVFQQSRLFVKTSLIAMIVHSLFLNSLLLPWVMVWFWVIAGAATYDDRPLWRRQTNQA